MKPHQFYQLLGFVFLSNVFADLVNAVLGIGCMILAALICWLDPAEKPIAKRAPEPGQKNPVDRIPVRE